MRKPWIGAFPSLMNIGRKVCPRGTGAAFARIYSEADAVITNNALCAYLFELNRARNFVR